MANDQISSGLQNLMAAAHLFPGWRFSPTDVQLISLYLKNKLEGSQKSVEIIPEIEIYKYEPWDLPAKSIVQSNDEWFFFSRRGRKYPNGNQIRRTTELGYWKPTGKERNVKSGTSVIGTRRTLVFHTGRAPKGVRTDWIMHEYSMIHKSDEEFLGICRLKKNSEFCQHHSLDVAQAAESKSSQKDDVETTESIPKSNKKDDVEAAESSGHLRDCGSDDIYNEILKDDIIKLDEFEPSTTSNLPPMFYYETESGKKFQQGQGTANRRIRLTKKKDDSGDRRSDALEASDSEKIIRKGKFRRFKLFHIWLVKILSSIRGVVIAAFIWFILLALLCLCLSMLYV